MATYLCTAFRPFFFVSMATNGSSRKYINDSSVTIDEKKLDTLFFFGYI
jgi:hypothetical protein